MKLLLAILSVLLFIPGIVQSDSGQGIRVAFSFKDSQNLIAQLRARGYNAESDDECCQPEDDALGIWIGRKVPVEDVRHIVTQAIQIYPWLVYYTYFGDEARAFPSSLDYSVYIGGSKYTAMCKTVPVPVEAALKIFNQINTREELDDFLSFVDISQSDNERSSTPETECR